MKTIVIGLDSQYDLAMASLPTDLETRQSLEDAYSKAAKEYGEIAGIDIEVKSIGYGSPSERTVDHYPLIWEDLHACLDYSEGHFSFNRERLKNLANDFQYQSENDD